MKKKIYIGIAILVLLLAGVYFGVILYQNNTLPEKDYWQDEAVIKFDDGTEKLTFKNEEIKPSKSYKDVEPKTFKITNDSNRKQVLRISATNVKPVNEGEIVINEFLVRVLILDDKGDVVYDGDLMNLNAMKPTELVEETNYCAIVNGEVDCTKVYKDVSGMKEDVDYVVRGSVGWERAYSPGNTEPILIKAKRTKEYQVYVWFDEELKEGNLIVPTYSPSTGKKGTAKASLDFDLTFYQIDAGLFKDTYKNNNSYMEKWNELVEEKTVTFKEFIVEAE